MICVYLENLDQEAYFAENRYCGQRFNLALNSISFLIMMILSYCTNKLEYVYDYLLDC